MIKKISWSKWIRGFDTKIVGIKISSKIKKEKLAFWLQVVPKRNVLYISRFAKYEKYKPHPQLIK